MAIPHPKKIDAKKKVDWSCKFCKKNAKKVTRAKGHLNMLVTISAASVGSTSGRRTFVHIPNWRGSSRRGMTVGVKAKPGELQGLLTVRERTKRTQINRMPTRKFQNFRRSSRRPSLN